MKPVPARRVLPGLLPVRVPLLLPLLAGLLLAAPALAVSGKHAGKVTVPVTGPQNAGDSSAPLPALPAATSASTSASTPVSTPDSDAAALVQALQRGLTRTVRGTVRVTVAFPPAPPGKAGSAATDPARAAIQLPALPFAPALLRRNFTVTSAGAETVAGRAATRYELTPRNPQAARWTLWVDAQWGLPLGYRSTLSGTAPSGMDSGGTLAREAVFVTVKRPVTRDRVQAVQAPNPALKAALLGALPGLTLPAGFEPVAVQARSSGAGVVLSDGLNVLALILSDRPVQAAPGVASRRLQGGAAWLVGTLPQSALEAALSGLTRLDLTRARDLPGTFLAPAPSDE